MNRFALVVVTLASGIARADARDPIVMLPGTTGAAPVLASTGDLTAALLTDSTGLELSLLLSDGRGLEWSSPVVLDPPGSADIITFRMPAVVGDRVLSVWADNRNSQATLWPLVASTLFVRVFDAKTGIAGPELEVPTGTLPAHTSSAGYDFVAHEVAGAVHLHIASLRRLLDPATGQSQNQVVLYSSHDGGGTWLAPLSVTPLGSAFYGQVRVLASDSEVHVLYADETIFTQPQLYDQRSLDGGLTVDFAQPEPVPGAFEAWSYDADLDGSLLAIAYENFAADFAFSAAAVVTSSDGGVTYHAAVGFGAPGVFVDQSFAPRVSIAAGSTHVTAVAAGTDLTSNAMILSVHSADGGQTWPDSALLAQGQVKRPEVAAAAAGRGRVAVTWSSGVGSAPPLVFATSFDAGASFGAPAPLTDIGAAGRQLVWNDLYQNAIVGFNQWAAPNTRYIGGYRPQSVAPSGFTPGSTSLGASFSGFDGGADLVWLLFSTNTGSFPLPLGDGRELGIGPSPLFTSLLPLALGGVFGAPLEPAGSGALAPLQLSAPGLPPGLSLFAVGGSFDLGGGGLVDLSDVVLLGT